MRRRELMSLLGAAMAVPRASRAQKTIPVVGILDPRPSHDFELFTNLRRGLAETGYREGQNVSSNITALTGITITCRRWRRSWFTIGCRHHSGRPTHGCAGEGSDDDNSDRVHGWRRPGFL